MARGTHVFNIAGYSLHKGVGVGNFIRSTAFSVGGYDWCIQYCPDGHGAQNKEYDSVFLQLLTKNAEVRAAYDMRLAIPATTDLRQPSSVFSRVSPKLFNDKNPTWGTRSFKKRSALEASHFLRDDRLVIVCDVTVFKEPRVEETALAFEVQVPPSDLSDNLRELLEAEYEADVTFKVEGEVFPAHKIVLAMRSPVFKAELYGLMRNKRRQNITVEDMQPAIFKALLHFIYTDSLPSTDDLDGDENREMVKHLLVAADRYAMERMKLMCESILCKSLDVDSVATTLALADQHHCSKLKDACIEFINSSNRMDDVVASQGYEHLKSACPAIFVDIWEKAARSHKI